MKRWHTLTPSMLYADTHSALLGQAGCYCLYLCGKAIYLGQTKRLSTRLMKHYNTYQMERGGWRIKVRPERTAGERAALEVSLIRRLRPRDNRQAAAFSTLGTPTERRAVSSMGGKARKAKLSPRRRSQIARQAAKARWSRPVITPDGGIAGYRYVGPPVTVRPTTESNRPPNDRRPAV